MSSLKELQQQATNQLNAKLAAQQPPRDATPSIPSAASVSTDASGATDTVAQAYLAALAAQTKNTAGDTSPYVVMSPGAGQDSGGGVSIVTVLVVAALGFGVWWFIKKRGGA